MTKEEFINAMAEKGCMTKVEARKACDAFLAAAKQGLKKENDRLSFLGFGTFIVVKRPARTGINPLTKKSIKIKAKKVVRFKPSKNLI